MEAEKVMLTQAERNEIWDALSVDAKFSVYAEALQEALLVKIIRWVETHSEWLDNINSTYMGLLKRDWAALKEPLGLKRD